MTEPLALLAAEENLEAVQPGRHTAYPAYKPSGVEWLGDVPEHWDVPPLYARYEAVLGRMLDEKRVVGKSLIPYLRNVDVQWDRVSTTDLPEMDIAPSDRERFTVQEGDLLVCEGGEVGRCAIWHSQLALCGFQKAIHRLRAQSARDIPRFLFYVLRCASSCGAFIAGSNPNTIPHLTGEKLRRHRFPMPPLEEQRAIVWFLDEQTQKVDALIEAKRSLLDLLKEKRQAVITHAVTRGLDPAAKLKLSGVEWLGEVPEHWQTTPLKHVARLESGHTPSRSVPEYWENCTIPWVSLADVGPLRSGRVDYVTTTEEKISQLGIDNSSARLLPAETVILSRTASVGFAGIISEPMATTQDFVNWICGPRLLPRYLLHCMRSMKQEFKKLTMGSTHQTIYMPDVGSFKIPLPSLSEQKRIDEFITDSSKKIDALTGKLEENVALLRELRNSLISAAVTGKIDVRSAAYKPEYEQGGV